jgi:type IV secretion system protein VirB10
MANDESQGASVPGADPAIQSDKSRGSFDLRTKRSGGGPNKKIYVGIAAIVIVFLTIVIVGWSLLISKMKEGSTQVDESKAKADVSLQQDKGTDESMAKAKAESVRLMKAQEEKDQRDKEAREQTERDRLAMQRNPPAATVPAQPNRAPSSDKPAQETPAQRKLAGGIVITPALQGVSESGATVAGGADASNRAGDGRSKQMNLAGLPGLDAAQGDTGGLGGQSRTRGSLSSLGGTTFAPSKAYLAPSRKYLVSHNTYTRCALYTEIDTDHPGLIDCRLTEPLYSADGSTVIADAGDRLTGEQSVELKPGQARVFTTWSELETQSGVRAKFDSLGAGPLGASGTEAWIDNHYKERFGGAVMLSVIQDVLQAVANTTQKSSGAGGYTVNNSEQNVENMASKALENSINIAPTGHIYPGTVMTVIVARDIDFSPVYENR